MNRLKATGAGLFVGCLLVALAYTIFLALFPNWGWTISEDGFLGFWTEGTYDIAVHNSGQSNEYSMVINDTRNVTQVGQLHFLFGSAPNWWYEWTGEEWLHPAEYEFEGPVFERGESLLVIRGWGEETAESFWMCYHNLGVCFARHDDLPTAYELSEALNFNWPNHTHN